MISRFRVVDLALFKIANFVTSKCVSIVDVNVKLLKIKKSFTLKGH